MSNPEVDLLTDTLSKALIQRGELQAENAANEQIIAEYRQLLVDLRGENAELTAENARLRAERDSAQLHERWSKESVDRLRAMLRRVEFVQQAPNLPRICLWCGGVWQHRQSCEWQSEFGAQEAKP